MAVTLGDVSKIINEHFYGYHIPERNRVLCASEIMGEFAVDILKKKPVIKPANFGMFDKERIVHNLASTELFTKSRIAELLGMRVMEVHNILKKPHPVIDNCDRGGCPTPLLCQRIGCQPDNHDSETKNSE